MIRQGYFLKPLKKILLFISSIADTHENTQEEKRQHIFLIYIAGLMTTGGLLWGSICLYTNLPYQAMIPFGYGIITVFNFIYLYLTKNFQIAQAVQILISLLLPFLFHLSLGGFIASGGMVIWSITAILGAFTFKSNHSIIGWFILYIALVVISGVLDERIVSLNLVAVPTHISILFFTINLSTVSFIVFTLFYYFVGSERKFRDYLEENLQTLKNAQEQLIESEKMSALGSLVAGVAHEVNTPLGISITAASIFKNEISDLQKSVKENTLTKTEINEFIENITKTDDLLIKNLNRAAQLIKNFKKISVDQSTDDLREFELNLYIAEVVSTLNNEMTHNNVKLTLELKKEGIHMNSYPGAISQIIINLLQNSLLHGFDGHQKGNIILRTQETDGQALIICEDDGKGVNKDVINKIFEPFVTTKRNEGGTGLGLNITYNLVTQHLEGTIKLDIDYTNGARFVISMPKELADRKDLKINYSI